MFFLACFSGRTIGLYLFNKGGELTDEFTNCRTKLRAYFSDAIAYGGYAIFLLAPLVTFFWLFGRTVVCHGSPFLCQWQAHLHIRRLVLYLSR